MAIQVDDYGRPLYPGESNGIPRNFSATNNGSNWQGPSYTTIWNAGQDNGMGGTGFVGTMANPSDPGSFGAHEASGGPGGGPGGGGGAPGGAGLPGILKTLRDLGIPLALAAAGGHLGGGSGSGMADLPPELQQLLALSMQRMQEQGPLFSAVNRQAMAGLPDYAKG